MTNRLFNALRDQQLGHVTTPPLPALASHRTAFNQRFQNFLDKERIPFGFAVNGDRKLTADILAQQRTELIARFSFTKATQRDASYQTFSVPVNERLGERVSAVELSFSIRTDDEYAFVT